MSALFQPSVISNNAYGSHEEKCSTILCAFGRLVMCLILYTKVEAEHNIASWIARLVVLRRKKGL